MSAAELIALAERCEREEPSRELEACIALSCGWTVHAGDNWIGPYGEICVPAFTHSIDAAATLVPEGWALEASRMRHGCHASVRNEDTQEEYRNSIGQYRGPNGGKVISLGEYVKRLKEAKTPALALCAAALRARASQIEVPT